MCCLFIFLLGALFCLFAFTTPLSLFSPS
uniref:Uncharacterized protein n=1 Tax=Anguilla anguilla TaxID=7936 RepID=A0A0E9UTM7_ANGAN